MPRNWEHLTGLSALESQEPGKAGACAYMHEAAHFISNRESRSHLHMQQQPLIGLIGLGSRTGGFRRFKPAAANTPRARPELGSAHKTCGEKFLMVRKGTSCCKVIDSNKTTSTLTHGNLARSLREGLFILS